MTTINENIRNAIEFLAILIGIHNLILLKYDDNIQNLIPSLTLFGAALYRLMPATNRLLKLHKCIPNLSNPLYSY